MNIDDIIIGERFRKDTGDLDALAASINEHGLLHAPVVTDKGELVVGYRRLLAAESLGWQDIPVRIVNPADLLSAENDENECRKDFTPSERVAIAEAIKSQLDIRKGRPNKGGQLPTFSKARDEAAKAAGFNSTDEYRRAKTVVEKGVPELVDAMDKGEVSPSAAAKVAKLPKKEQRKAVKEKKVKEKAKEQTSPEETSDGEAFVKEVEILCRDMDAVAKRMKALKESKYAYSIHTDSAVSQVEAARKTLWQGRPSHDCPYCSKSKKKDCNACKGTKRVKKSTYDAGIDAVGGDE